MLPFTTTNVRIERWRMDQPGQRQIVGTYPAVISNISSKQAKSYRGTSEGGWYEDATAMLNLNAFVVKPNDIVVDVQTSLRYRVQGARWRSGLGLDHLESALNEYHQTGLYSILRGSSKDQFGDDVPTLTPVAQNIEGEVREIDRDVKQPTTQQPGTVSSLSGRFPPFVDIRMGDQVLNQLTGTIYAVRSVGTVTSTEASDTDIELVINR